MPLDPDEAYTQSGTSRGAFQVTFIPLFRELIGPQGPFTSRKDEVIVNIRAQQMAQAHPVAFRRFLAEFVDLVIKTCPPAEAPPVEIVVVDQIATIDSKVQVLLDEKAALIEAQRLEEVAVEVDSRLATE